MKQNLFHAAGRVLAAVALTLIVTLMLTPAARGATEKVIHTFVSDTDGSGPAFGLILDAAGNLYGARGSGGAYGHGTVFQLVPNPDSTWTFNVIHHFTGGEDGDNPGWGKLAIDAAGDLYGATYSGGLYGMGVFFMMAPNPDGTWTENILHQFTGGDDGGYPEGTPIFDSAGNIYSTATWNGVIFMLSPNPDGSWTENVLYEFGFGSDQPWAGVVFDASGNLYGTTRYGAYDHGTLFELTPNLDGTWSRTVLHNFTGGQDGADPSVAGLTFDPAGNLFGITERGGIAACGDGCGTVFEMTPDLRGHLIYSFTGRRDGGHSNGPIVFDASGSMYAAPWYGGAHGFGVVDKATPCSGKHPDCTGWQKSVLYSFKGGNDGASPVLGVTIDSAGNVYGVTTAGGANNVGVIYEITQ